MAACQTILDGRRFSRMQNVVDFELNFFLLIESNKIFLYEFNFFIKFLIEVVYSYKWQ